MPPPSLHSAACPHIRSPRCQLRPIPRLFSTSALSHRPAIGPESPNFIHVPRAPQPEAYYRPHVKGILPFPRRIFPRTDTDATDKTSPSYLAATTPDPSPRTLNAPKPKDPSTRRFVEWKSQIAEHRRRNLRESLVELKDRKTKIDSRIGARAAAKQRERARLLSAPTPPDEKYTAASVLQSSLPSRRGLQDPDREARIERKRANFAAHDAMKKAERRNALHTLYMNARDFIVTEEKLGEAVERAFDPDSTQFTNQSRHGLNVWNLGFPETVKEQLERANRGESGRAVDRLSGFGGVTDERMRKIGEELTGGKM
ncbi:MAG: hypothetical protein L6R40_000348 [Gallowayella cf. fulva]|nr:MAG: hypothetical protein L6R40_000348 [Xanthomendoza cf. fulva]